jgi:hypothetical protein
MKDEERHSRQATVALGVVLPVVLGAVVWVMLSPIDLPFQRRPLSMHMAPKVAGDTVTVSGATDLPDGALIDWYLMQGLVDELPSGQVAVKNGQFVLEADVSQLAPGPAEAQVSFSCNYGTLQPKPVLEVVGAECEHLDGAQVYVDSPGDTKQLSVTVAFTVP